MLSIVLFLALSSHNAWVLITGCLSIRSHHQRTVAAWVLSTGCLSIRSHHQRTVAAWVLSTGCLSIRSHHQGTVAKPHLKSTEDFL